MGSRVPAPPTEELAVIFPVFDLVLGRGRLGAAYEVLLWSILMPILHLLLNVLH